MHGGFPRSSVGVTLNNVTDQCRLLG